MGWSYTNEKNITKKEYVKEELESFEKSGYKVLKSKLAKGGYFALIVHPDGHKFILTAMVEKYDGCYGSKTMTEDMGPYMVGCPIEWFDEVECPNEYAKAFRESNVEYAKTRKWQPKEGDKVTIHGKPYTVEYKLTRIQWAVRGEDGVIYRAKKADMKYCE